MRIALPALLVLAACHPQTPPPATAGERVTVLPGATALPAPDGSSPPATPDVCDAAPVQDLLGKSPDGALADDARRRAHASVIRYLSPNQPATKDYREDRLNLHVDAAGKISAVRCG